MDLFEIPDFTGYKIDKNGNVYSFIKQGCRNKFDRTKWLTEPVKLKERLTKTGYCRVFMKRDSTNKREDVYVHRLVAEMFIKNPYNLSDVNHKDSNPRNNSVTNLEWLSHKDNLNYGFGPNGNKARNEFGQFTHK